MPTVSVKKLDENNRPTTENDKSIVAFIGENLFEAFDEANYALPHACLSGACCACKVEVLKGHENLSPPMARELDSLNKFKINYENKNGENSLKGRQIRLSCQTSIATDEEVIIAPLKN